MILENTEKKVFLPKIWFRLNELAITILHKSGRQPAFIYYTKLHLSKT